MDIEKLISNNLSQTYIFFRSDFENVISVFEKKFGVVFGKDQNAILFEIENFGIDNSRMISEIGSLKNNEETFIAISAGNIRVEAQQALLKTLEEPSSNVHFLLFVENPDLLLPTLLSRAIVVRKGESVAGKNSHPDFLKISLVERFEYIEKLSKKYKKEKPDVFRSSALSIFDNVILNLNKDLMVDGKVVGEKILDKGARLEKVLELRKYLGDRGSSPKQLLETLSMQL